MNERRMCDEWVFRKCVSEAVARKAKSKVRWRHTTLGDQPVACKYLQRLRP